MGSFGSCNLQEVEIQGTLPACSQPSAWGRTGTQPQDWRREGQGLVLPEIFRAGLDPPSSMGGSSQAVL